MLLPSAGASPPPEGVAASVGYEIGSGPPISSSSSSSRGEAESKENPEDVLLAALQQLAGFVRRGGTELNFGFAVYAELIGEAGEEIHAVCRGM